MLLGQHGDLDVFKDRQPVKDVYNLKRPPDSSPADLVRGKMADVFSLEEDLSPVPPEMAGDEIKQGRFAGAVGADDRNNLPFLDRKVGLVDRHEVVEAFHDPFHLEHLRRSPFPRFLPFRFKEVHKIAHDPFGQEENQQDEEDPQDQGPVLRILSDKGP